MRRWRRRRAAGFREWSSKHDRDTSMNRLSIEARVNYNCRAARNRMAAVVEDYLAFHCHLCRIVVVAAVDGDVVAVAHGID